ncbi:MAG: cytochrome c biogenesis protein CcsA [Granulosicoccaceae bacterium]|jgi:ABC-type uncharacterized transport system permease subunit
MDPVIITTLAIALYLATTFLLGRRLAAGQEAQQANRLPLLSLGFGAVILHGSVLATMLITDSGINLGFFNALSLVTALVALLMLVTALFQRIESLGIVILPLAALAMLLEQLIPGERILLNSKASHIELHIVLSLLAYSLLGIAALQAVLLAIQDRQLRHKHPGGFMRALPPMQEMENLLFRLIAGGFVLLSLSLLTGVLYLEDIFAQHLVHKTVLSLLAWSVFGILLAGRWLSGWRGRTAIRWTLAGFGVLLLAYFGSKLVLELILNN